MRQRTRHYFADTAYETRWLLANHPGDPRAVIGTSTSSPAESIGGLAVPNHILDLRLFQYALVSAEQGSFRRAAAALNVQQSTVSRGVRSLEHRVGAELFERGYAGIRPTPAGNRFLEEAMRGFDYLTRAMQRVGALQRGEHGELMVSVSMPLSILGDAFERFKEEYAGISVEIVESTTRKSRLLVEQRKVDIAFVASIPANGALRALHLPDQRLVAVLPKYHPMAVAREVDLQELQRELFILSASGLPAGQLSP
jgi:DNA-binding transcriptional LysR family regulator